jgi:hypothetical protein
MRRIRTVHGWKERMEKRKRREEEEKKERGEKEREVTGRTGVAGGGCHCGWSEACPTTSPRLLLSTPHRSDQGSRIAVD